MAVRKVLQLGDPKLRDVAERVQDAASQVAASVAEDLRDTLAHWRNETGYGRGIAAPQIGVLQRVIYLKVPGAAGEFEAGVALVNPEIVWRSAETMTVWDACLSFLCIFMKVERNREIVVRYENLRGERKEVKAGVEWDLSELLQHEIDHLDGILCIDRVEDVKTIVTKEEFEGRFRMESPYKE